MIRINLKTIAFFMNYTSLVKGTDKPYGFRLIIHWLGNSYSKRRISCFQKQPQSCLGQQSGEASRQLPIFET
jgi:hypothetical protein